MGTHGGPDYPAKRNCKNGGGKNRRDWLCKRAVGTEPTGPPNRRPGGGGGSPGAAAGARVQLCLDQEVIKSARTIEGFVLEVRLHLHPRGTSLRRLDRRDGVGVPEGQGGYQYGMEQMFEILTPPTIRQQAISTESSV